MANTTTQQKIDKIWKTFNADIQTAWKTGTITDDPVQISLFLEKVAFAVCDSVHSKNRNAEYITKLLKEAPLYKNNEAYSSLVVEQIVADAINKYNATVPPSLSKVDAVTKFLISNEITVFLNECDEKIYMRREDQPPQPFEDNHITEIWDAYLQGDPAITVASWQNMEKILRLIAGRNKVNPVKETFEQLPQWDQRDRIADAVAILTGKPENGADENAAVYELYLLYFLMQAYEMATADKPQGADYILVLQGEAEGTGKTRFVSMLYMAEYFEEKYSFRAFDEIRSFDPDDKDQLMRAVCRFGVELSEFGDSARREEAMKAFITNRIDSFRKPYGHNFTDKPRRTTYIGTVNRPDFLPARAGNRRFLVIPVRNERFIEEFESFDFMQLWSQAKEKAEEARKEVTNPKTQKLYSLPEDMQNQVIDSNRAHTEYIPGELELEDYLHEAEGDPKQYYTEWIDISTFKDLLPSKYTGLRNCDNKDFGLIVKKLGIEKKKSKKWNLYSLPVPIEKKPILQKNRANKAKI